MKPIKTYIQARRHEFSNNGGGVGLLGGGGGWLLGLLLGSGVGVGVGFLGIGSDIGVGVGVGVGIININQFVIGKQIDILYAGFFGWWWNYGVFKRIISWFLKNYNECINVSKTK